MLLECTHLPRLTWMFLSCPDSLRAKLGSALELLRLYQHKLQVLESMPAGITLEARHPARNNSRCRTDGCSNCIRMSPGAPLAGPIRGPHDEEAAASSEHETGNCSQTSRISSMQPNPVSLPAQGEALAFETTRQPELCCDPSIHEVVQQVLAAKQTGAPAAQPVGTHCREHAAHSAHDSIALEGHSDQCKVELCGSQTRTRASEQGYSSCKCQKELAGDPWAFMSVSQDKRPKHAVRPFNGDLLSLVSDIDEMMSCSGKALAEPSDTSVSDSSNTSCSY